MLNPDEINELLETPPYTLDMDERTERKVRASLDALADEIGDEAFDEFGMQFLLSIEDYLRETCPPDAPAIRVLDEYHARRF